MCILVCMTKHSQLSLSFTTISCFMITASNYCNGNPRLKWSYLYNCSFKSYNYKTVKKPRLNTLLSSTYPKCDSCSVKCYITPNQKWPNIATVFEPTVHDTLAAGHPGIANTWELVR